MGNHTIYDIAKHFAVSSVTVSRVINNKDGVSESTRKKIKDYINEIGYQPNINAQNLKNNKSMLLGMIITGSFDNPFTYSILRHFREDIDHHGYDLILFQSLETLNLDHIISRVNGRNIDGLLVLGFDSIYDHWNFEKINIPLVSINCRINYSKATAIFSNHYEGSLEGLNFLYKNNHREIAFIGQEGIECIPVQERRRGYDDFIKQNGLFSSPEWNYNCSFDIDKVDEISKGFIEFYENLKNKPTAFFCSWDVIAVEILKAIRSKPYADDISILGFDDLPSAAIVSPQLTTIRQNTTLISHKASEILRSKANKKYTGSKDLLIPTELIIRESIKKKGY